MPKNWTSTRMIFHVNCFKKCNSRSLFWLEVCQKLRRRMGNRLRWIASVGAALFCDHDATRHVFICLSVYPFIHAMHMHTQNFVSRLTTHPFLEEHHIWNQTSFICLAEQSETFRANTISTFFLSYCTCLSVVEFRRLSVNGLGRQQY